MEVQALWIYCFLIACIISIALLANNASENLKKAYKNLVLFKFGESLNSINAYVIMVLKH